MIDRDRVNRLYLHLARTIAAFYEAEGPVVDGQRRLQKLEVMLACVGLAIETCATIKDETTREVGARHLMEALLTGLDAHGLRPDSPPTAH